MTEYFFFNLELLSVNRRDYTKCFLWYLACTCFWHLLCATLTTIRV